MLVKIAQPIESPYLEIYELVIPKDNLLRKVKELINFDFIIEELESKYCHSNGRNAISPIRMFKYLFLKILFDLSDVDIVERSKYDMSFKYFLDMAPEENVIDASSLTKFRTLRLKDMDLLDLLINKTVSIAIEKGIIKSKSIIVDATHTTAKYTKKSPCQLLKDKATSLRKAVYKIDGEMKSKFPNKLIGEDLQKELEYCQKLIDIVEGEPQITQYPKIREKINVLVELMQEDIENINSVADREAKTGHKSADSNFFGYKTHIAMTQERIITAATVTTGDKNDGKQLEELYKKSKSSGVEIDTIIGDAAYSEKGNIELAKSEDVKLVAKLHPSVTQGFRSKEDEFEFNKDAGLYVCKAGHLAVRKARQGAKNKSTNQVDCYYFDVEKCKKCALKEGCYKEGAKTKTYSVTIKSDIHKDQIAFQETEYFKEKSKERYKIEAKNGELKNRHGYNICNSSGLLAMQLQGAVTMFVVNVKRIIKLLDEK